MLSSLVLSEPMFAALLFPVVIGAERLVRDDNNTRHIVLVAIGLGILALVRTHAIALTIALLAVLVMRRRWRTAMLCARDHHGNARSLAAVASRSRRERRRLH